MTGIYFTYAFSPINKYSNFYNRKHLGLSQSSFSNLAIGDLVYSKQNFNILSYLYEWSLLKMGCSTMPQTYNPITFQYTHFSNLGTCLVNFHFFPAIILGSLQFAIFTTV